MPVVDLRVTQEMQLFKFQWLPIYQTCFSQISPNKAVADGLWESTQLASNSGSIDGVAVKGQSLGNVIIALN